MNKNMTPVAAAAVLACPGAGCLVAGTPRTVSLRASVER
jgi:hypothetical protein